MITTVLRPGKANHRFPSWLDIVASIHSGLMRRRCSGRGETPTSPGGCLDRVFIPRTTLAGMSAEDSRRPENPSPLPLSAWEAETAASNKANSGASAHHLAWRRTRMLWKIGHRRAATLVPSTNQVAPSPDSMEMPRLSRFTTRWSS